MVRDPLLKQVHKAEIVLRIGIAPIRGTRIPRSSANRVVWSCPVSGRVETQIALRLGATQLSGVEKQCIVLDAVSVQVT